MFFCLTEKSCSVEMNFHLRQFWVIKKLESLSVLAGLAQSGRLNRIEEGIKVIFFMNFHNLLEG
jgi:hypothetical protein